MYCSITFWLGHLSGICTGQPQSARKLSNVIRLLFHALLCMYECMHVCTYIYMCVYNIQYSLARILERNGVNYALVIGMYTLMILWLKYSHLQIHLIAEVIVTHKYYPCTVSLSA